MSFVPGEIFLPTPASAEDKYPSSDRDQYFSLYFLADIHSGIQGYFLWRGSDDTNRADSQNLQSSGSHLYPGINQPQASALERKTWFALKYAFSLSLSLSLSISFPLLRSIFFPMHYLVHHPSARKRNFQSYPNSRKSRGSSGYARDRARQFQSSTKSDKGCNLPCFHL